MTNNNTKTNAKPIKITKTMTITNETKGAVKVDLFCFIFLRRISMFI